MKKFTLLVTLLAFAGYLSAQNGGDESKKEKPDSWAFSLNGGSSQFYGDIASNTYFYPWFPKDGDLSFSAFGTFEKHFNPYYALRLRGGYISYTSTQDPGSSQSVPPNTGLLDTESTILDIYLENKFSLSNLFWPDKYSKKLSLYALLGYGIPFYRTLLKDQSGNIIGSEGYSNNGQTEESRETAGSVSVGLGLRYKISHNFAISLEANIESLNNDNLDAAKHALSEMDKYGYTALGVVYTFGKNKETVPVEYHPVPEEDRAIEDKLDSLDQALKDVNDKVDEVDDKVEQLAARWDGPDSDNDGISDSYDKESGTEPGALVNHKGVTIEDCCDKVDEMTQKPDVSTGQYANSDIAYESVYFGLNSTYITPDNMKKVAKVAKIMNNNKDVKFKIVGSACKISSDNYNRDLSKRRANAVKDALVENFGISANRITIEFVGENEPVAKKPLYINRRADFFMIK